MNALFRILLIGIFLYMSSAIPATEKLNITNYTVHDGLSQNTIRCMMQDQQGFLWFGTSNGLNRYDGHHFRIIQAGGNGSALDRRFNKIAQDKAGYIWVFTLSGSCFCYDPVTEGMTEYAGRDGGTQFKDLMVAANGDVWLYGDSGCAVVRHNPDHTLTMQRPAPAALATGNVVMVHEDSRHNIWIAAEKGLFRFTGGKASCVDKGHTYYNIHESGDYLYFGDNSHILPYDMGRQRLATPSALPRQNTARRALNHLLPDMGLLLVLTNNAILYYDTRSHTWAKNPQAIERQLFGGQAPKEAYPITYEGGACIANFTGRLWIYNQSLRRFDNITIVPNEGKMVYERYRILRYDKDNYWIISQHNGIAHYNQAQRTLQHYDTKEQLPTNNIRGILKDHTGDLWVATLDHGVLHIKQGYRYYDRMLPVPSTADMSLNNIRMTYADRDGRLWLGTKSDVRLVYVTKPGQSAPEHTLSLPGGSAYCMTELPSGEKLIGTKPGGIYRVSADGGKITEHILLAPPSAANNTANNVYQMLTDRKNRLWAATYGGGVFMLTEQDGKYAVSRKITFGHAPHNFARCIAQDKQGQIWVGTNDGIVMFNADAILKNPKAYTHFPIACPENSNNTEVEVKALLIDRNGTLWVGTSGLGIYYADLGDIKNSEQPFTHLGTTPQSHNFIIQSLAIDNQGTVWATAEDHIIRINKDYRKHPSNGYNTLPTSGMPIYNESAACTMKDGMVLLGSNDGIYLVNPSRYTGSRHVPVMLSALKIHGQYVYPGNEDSPLSQSITLTDRIRLTHRQNTFTLECATKDYRSPGNGGYCYSFEKEGNEPTHWMQTGESNEITFHNLQPGDYCLRVKSDINSPASTERTLIITVLPPWWQTWWAYLFYAMILSAICYVAYRHTRNIMRLRAENAAERSLSEYKMRFFSRVSHDLRTPLTIIQGSLEALPQNEEHTQFTLSKKQMGMLNRNADKLLTLIDKVLAFQDSHDETAMRQHIQETAGEAEKLLSAEENSGSSYTAERQEVLDMKKYRILVIDDNEDMLQMLGELLSQTFTVSTAMNGAEGISLLDEVQPDLIVCDVMMPEMDGFEFTRRLRSDFNVSHIPVILLTATVSDEARLKGIELGADAYITKPFSKDFLMARIVGLIDQRQKLQRRYATEPTTSAPFISATERDKQFIDRVNEIIDQNINNFDFKLDEYAAEFHIGRTTFFAKIKSIIGYTPYEYVRMTRMKRAAELLLNTDLNISEIGYKVGVNDPYSFSRIFKQTFGKSPTQYRKDVCEKSGKQ